MNKRMQPFIICFYHLKLCLRSPRVIIMLVLLFMYLHSMLEPIIDFSRTVQIEPTIWFLPFLMNDLVAQLILTLGGVILFCDAPFHSNMEHYLLIRANYRRWNIGQVLYIISAAFLYVFFIVISTSIIMLLGSGIEFSMNWGKIWGSLANTDAGGQFSIPMGFHPYVYARFLPQQAFLYSFVLEWCVISLIGLICYTLNRLKQHMGTMIAAFITLFDFMIANELPYIFYKISPVSLAKISNLTGSSIQKKPSLTYGFLFFTIGILILCFFAIWYPYKAKWFNKKRLEYVRRRLK